MTPLCSWDDEPSTHKLVYGPNGKVEGNWTDYACDAHTREYGHTYDRVESLGGDR